MSRSRFDMSLAMFAVAAGLGAAIATSFALSMLARPMGIDEQTQGLARQADEAEGLLRKVKGAPNYPAGAICDSGPDAAVAGLTKAIGGAPGVTLASLNGIPRAPDEAHGGLQPISVSVQASGQYGALVGMLKSLSQVTPTFFVDTLDLKSEAGTIKLKMSGRTFCSAVRP